MGGSAGTVGVLPGSTSGEESGPLLDSYTAGARSNAQVTRVLTHRRSMDCVTGRVPLRVGGSGQWWVSVLVRWSQRGWRRHYRLHVDTGTEVVGVD